MTRLPASLSSSDSSDTSAADGAVANPMHRGKILWEAIVVSKNIENHAGFADTPTEALARIAAQEHKRIEGATKRVRDYTSGILGLGESHCAMCTLKKSPIPKRK